MNKSTKPLTEYEEWENVIKPKINSYYKTGEKGITTNQSVAVSGSTLINNKSFNWGKWAILGSSII